MTPRFYSKWAIGGLTLILSPFFGCILFSYNLREIGKERLSPFFIIVGLFWTFIFKKLTMGVIGDNIFQFLFSNVLGSLILTYFLWDKFFINYPTYETKPVWKPLIVFVSICGALLLFQILATRHK